MEFSGIDQQPFFIKAAEPVICLMIHFEENHDLEDDPVFLRFALNQVARKLSLSVILGPLAEALKEKGLFYLRNIRPDHQITSINKVLPQLHCSRRQLQRLLKKLCQDHKLVRTGRGTYQLQ